MTFLKVRSTMAALAIGAGACGDEELPPSATSPRQETTRTIRNDAPVAQAEVLARIKVGGEPCAVATAAGLVWVSDYDGRVVGVDPETETVALEVEVHGRACDMAADGDRLWVVTDHGDYLEGIDARSGRVIARIRGERGRGRPALGEGEIWWSSDTQNQTVSRYDDSGKLVRRVPEVGSVEAGPTDLARGAGALWVGNQDGTIQRLDAESGAVTDTIEGGLQPALLRFHDRALWFANLEHRTIRRLDPTTKRVTHVLEGGGGEFVFDDAGSLWAVGANATSPDGAPEPALIYRYDARTGEPAARLRVAKAPAEAGDLPPLSGIALADGSAWVASPSDGILYRVGLG